MPPRQNVRLQGKKFLLTYPQCTLSKEEVRQVLVDEKSTSEYTIASELHQDGTPHIHAVILLSSSPRTTNMRYFDIAGFHPNIKVLKTKNDYENASKYVKKDGDFITNVTVRLSAKATLFKALIENPGGLTKQFVRDHPEIMALNFNVLRQWMAFLRPELSNPVLRILPKRRHIWISGKANSGKSYHLNARCQLYFYPSEIPRNNDFSGIGPETDLLFSDEYSGFLTIQQLNRLCDGASKLNTKGGSTILGYPIIIIVSNFTIEECYPLATPEILDTLYSRFNRYIAPIFPKFPTCEL